MYGTRMMMVVAVAAMGVAGRDMGTRIVMVEEDPLSPEAFGRLGKSSKVSSRRTPRVIRGPQFPDATHDRERARRLRQQAARQAKLQRSGADPSAI